MESSDAIIHKDAIIAYLLIFLLIVGSAAPSLSSIVAAQPSDNSDFRTVFIGFSPGKHDMGQIISANGKIKKDFSPFINVVEATLPAKAIDAISKNPNVRFVEEDQTFVALGHDSQISSPGTVEYTNSWGVDHINADRVHLNAFKNSGTGIKVAVLDTGIDYNVPELKQAYKGGYDFVNNDSDPMDTDSDSHGTFVSGIIAAARDGVNVVGVAPSVDLYAIRISDFGTFQTSNIVSGLQWAVDNQMNIINMSFGSASAGQTLIEAIRAVDAAGILMIAGSGNDNTNTVLFPAAFDEVIAVGATDKLDKRWSSTTHGSNYGPALDLVAPGVDIKSTVTLATQGFNVFSGTSDAAPHVTGVAALIWSNGIATTSAGVRSVLLNTADDLGPLGRDDEYGHGLVDADAAAGVPAVYETAVDMHPDPDVGFIRNLGYPPVDIPTGKSITVKGRVFSNEPFFTSDGIGRICSEPCVPQKDKVITFTGISATMPPFAIPPSRTGEIGEYSTTFSAPSTIGSWDIQAHFAEDTPYQSSDSILLTFVTFADSDHDGIVNEIDTSPNVASVDFSDKSLPGGGKTAGRIIDKGNQILFISEELNPKGVRIQTDPAGGSNPARISISCGAATAAVEVIPASVSRVYCGSASVETISGPSISVEFFAPGDGTATPFASLSLPEGNIVTFDATSSSILAPITNRNTLDVLLRGVSNPLSLVPDNSIVADVTPPIVTGSPDRNPDKNGWYNHGLTIHWTGDDSLTGGNGIASCDSDTAYSGPDGKALSVEGHCIDNRGNIGTGNVAVDFDKTEPEISSVQDGKSFTLGQTLAPEFQCTDTTSQIDTCVADITKLDTSSVGAKSYHVTGFDKAGNTRAISVNYEIHYKFVGISPPSLDTKVKQGSTIPLKFKLLDNGNKPISTASARLYIDGVAGECSGNSGNAFKYDSREQQYSCGMLTKQLTIGTHAIEIRLDDGTVHKYIIRLTK